MYLEQIEAVEAALQATLKALGPIPEVYGREEIRQEAQLALRYTGKLRDALICCKCGEDLLPGEPTVQYFKAQMHERCQHLDTRVR